MSFNKTIFILFFILGLTEIVSAETFLEPLVGYQSESLKLSNLSNAVTEISMAAPVYGLRLGYRNPIGIELNLAGEYASGKASYKPLVEKNNYTHTTTSIQLGVSAMGLMKIYLGYGLMDELKIETGLSNSDLKLSGQLYQVGLQIKLFSVFDLVGQYNLHQFNSVQGTNYKNSDQIEKYFNKLVCDSYSASLVFSF